jgi:hypothetical protein
MFLFLFIDLIFDDFYNKLSGSGSSRLAIVNAVNPYFVR